MLSSNEVPTFNWKIDARYDMTPLYEYAIKQNCLLKMNKNVHVKER